ncbi:MAG TPA: DUF4160 domain-containing protein [Mucilaginibacter sp.]|jgi:hypothetical protein|nr:DUF4160 domain-containing protein [Mucilaginibacter sp.]
MPLYELIDGIKINVYSNDHLPPHIHALYNEYEAVVSITDKKVIRGLLPIPQLKKVKEIITGNEDDLLALFKALNPQIKNL